MYGWTIKNLLSSYILSDSFLAPLSFSFWTFLKYTAFKTAWSPQIESYLLISLGPFRILLPFTNDEVVSAYVISSGVMDDDNLWNFSISSMKRFTLSAIEYVSGFPKPIICLIIHSEYFFVGDGSPSISFSSNSTASTNVSVSLYLSIKVSFLPSSKMLMNFIKTFTINTW